MYKLVVVSALVAVCAAQILQDTPEVAQAKAAHFAAYAEAQARSVNTNTPVYNPHVPVVAPVQPVYNPVYNPAPVVPWKVWDGIPAPIVVANGHVQDTAEVSAEKNKHFNLVADAAVRASSTGPNDDGKYRHDPTGDYAVPYVNTPVVPVSYVNSPYVNVPVLRNDVHTPYHYSSVPLVVSNGFIQDTPEVAALKAARLAELRTAGGTV